MKTTQTTISRLLRSGWAVIVAALMLMLSLAFWLRSGTGLSGTERIPSASSLGSTSEPSSDSLTTTTSDRNKARQQDSAAAQEQSVDELLATFLAAQAIEHPVEQCAALSRCMENLTPEMAKALLANLNADDLKGVAAQRLFDHWATAHPSEAAAWALGQDDPETSRPFLNVAALRWAVMDLRAASNWGRSLPEGDLRTDVLTAVGSEALRSDPVEALRLAAELPTGEAQADMVCRAAAEWAVTDQDSALKWAGQIADEALFQRVMGQIAVGLAEQDPIGAATIALRDMSQGLDQDRVIVSIVERWVQTDPKAASAWVSQFPENNLGRYGVESLVNLWADRYLITSGVWLRTLPAGALRDAGILAYSRVVRRTDPELADRWASSIARRQ